MARRVWNLPALLDTHTQLAGSESGESAENILSCLDSCGVDRAFVIAPIVDLRSWQLGPEHLEDLRVHNDYCADIVNRQPERLFGFSVLDPAPALADGSLERAVELMREEVQRCYHDLGLRGVKMVPAGWYPHDPLLVQLFQEIAELGMYVVFHRGAFLDAFESSYCRPSFFEEVHRVRELKVQMTHVGWPWADECVGVPAQESTVYGSDPAAWQMRCDMSFGAPADWQQATWQHAVDSLPQGMLIYGSDTFWPSEPDEYREQYLQPQPALFEAAMTNGHLAGEGTGQRAELRRKIFHGNAWEHWNNAVRGPQRPRAARRPLSTPRALTEHGTVSGGAG